MTFPLPNLTWPPPINGQQVFFSEKSFRLYSGTLDFATYLANKQEELGWTYSEEENKVHPKPQQPKNVVSSGQRQDSQRTTLHLQRASLQSAKSDSVTDQELNPESKSKSTTVFPLSAGCHGKPPVPFPQPSSLSKADQLAYLQLSEKYQTYVPKKPTPSERQEKNQLRELQHRITAEQEKCQSFLEGVAAQLSADYEYLHPDAAKYMEEWLVERRNRVQQYARYYVQHDSVPLAPPTVLKDLRLMHMQRLLHMGEIPKASVPKVNPEMGPSNQSLLSLKYDNVSQRYPVQMPTAKPGMWNKQVVSEDDNCQRLAVTCKVDIVISGSTLRCLLESSPGYPRQWELPVVVKMHTDHEGKEHKVVYIDKPFVPKTLSAREKNLMYHKYAMKTNWLLPNHRGTIRLGKSGQVCDVDAEEDTEDDVSDGGHGNFTVYDSVFSCDSSAEMDSLETFGLSNLGAKQTMKKGACDKKKKGSICENVSSQNKKKTRATSGEKKSEATRHDETGTPSVLETLTPNLKQKSSVKSVQNAKEMPVLQSSTCSDSEDEKLVIDCHDGMQTGASLPQTDGPRDQPPVKRKRGRPPKKKNLLIQSQMEDAVQSEDGESESSPATRKRGRPPKLAKLQQSTSTADAVQCSNLETVAQSSEESEHSPAVRKRGRPPRLTRVPHSASTANAQQSNASETVHGEDADRDFSPVTRKRGRPPKLAKEAVDYTASSSKACTTVGVAPTSQKVTQLLISDGSPVASATEATGRNVEKRLSSSKQDTSSEEDNNDCDNKEEMVISKGAAASSSSLDSDSVAQSATSESDATETEAVLEKARTMSMMTGQESNQRKSRQQHTRQQVESGQTALRSCQATHQSTRVKKNPSAMKQTIPVRSPANTNPLEHILQGQEKLGQMGKQANICIEQEDLGSHMSGSDKLGSVQYDSKQWEPVEDCSKYIPPVTKKNLAYDTWTFGNLKLLIRTNVHGNFRKKIKKKSRHVVMMPKLEYQPCYGYEQVTHCEAAAAWTHLTLKHDCLLIRARINAFNQKVMMVEKIDTTSNMPRTSFNPLAASNILHQILSKLQCLGEGQYLLSHAVGGTHATIKKTTASKKGVYDLHLAYTMMGYKQPTARSPLQWIPLDTNLLLPHQKQYNRIPVTFQPRGSSNANLKKKPWQKRKKKKKKNKGGGGAKQPN